MVDIVWLHSAHHSRFENNHHYGTALRLGVVNGYRFFNDLCEHRQSDLRNSVWSTAGDLPSAVMIQADSLLLPEPVACARYVHKESNKTLGLRFRRVPVQPINHVGRAGRSEVIHEVRIRPKAKSSAE